MKLAVEIKNGEEKMKALQEVEMHIKEAKKILSWALSSPFELEMQGPSKKDGPDD